VQNLLTTSQRHVSITRAAILMNPVSKSPAEALGRGGWREGGEIMDVGGLPTNQKFWEIGCRGCWGGGAVLHAHLLPTAPLAGPLTLR
jgi:hypothetical protein